MLATAAARSPDGRGVGPALVVTPQQVILFHGSKAVAGSLDCHEYDIADISSVEMLQSLPGCRFDIFLPAEEEVDKMALRYDYPDSPAFVRAFITLRHLLGQPLHG